MKGWLFLQRRGYADGGDNGKRRNRLELGKARQTKAGAEQKRAETLIKNLNYWRQGPGKKYLHTGKMIKPDKVSCDMLYHMAKRRLKALPSRKSIQARGQPRTAARHSF